MQSFSSCLYRVSASKNYYFRIRFAEFERLARQPLSNSHIESQKDQETAQREAADVEQNIDDDIKAVENLFSQLSIYCNNLELNNGFSPQIIVTDHADNLKLSNGVEFESLVNGNRWRKRGLIAITDELSAD